MRPDRFSYFLITTFLWCVTFCSSWIKSYSSRYAFVVLKDKTSKFIGVNQNRKIKTFITI